MENVWRIKKIAQTPVSTAFKHASRLIKNKFCAIKKVKLENELLPKADWEEAKFPAAFLRSLMSGSVESAAKICNHEFDLLGSGLKNLGKNINWQTDFKSGYEFPLIPSDKVKYLNLKDNCSSTSLGLVGSQASAAKGRGASPSEARRAHGGNVVSPRTDVKIPWELSRFQFLPNLIRAYKIHHEVAPSRRGINCLASPRLGLDEKYAQTCRDLIQDWIFKNPLGAGVNWKSAMECAIRLCNFGIAWHFLKHSPSWKNSDFEKKFLTSIAEHGKFIARNLEYGFGYSNNHLIADFTGLLFAGILFPQFKEAKKWQAKGLLGLEKEMQKQVYDDGVDAEASVGYHRLVCELFGYSYLVAQENGINFSPKFTAKLEKMFEFVWHYTKPNGNAPQIGDSDDGRLFIFEDFYGWNKNDHRYLFKLAQKLFPLNKKFEQNDVETAKHSEKFEKSGIYIIREKDFYCIVDCGDNGQNKNGGHCHNDTLSFELCMMGEDFIIDPGTYTYTTNLEERNRFRGTKMHNTVMVDNQEINRFLPDSFFSISNDARPQATRWTLNEKEIILDCRHNGYERLRYPLIHRRIFTFNKENVHFKLVDDFFEAKGTHTLEWNFHFAAGVKCVQEGNIIILEKNGKKIKFEMPARFAKKIKIAECEISPSYGVKQAAQKLMIEENYDSSQPEAFIFTFQEA